MDTFLDFIDNPNVLRLVKLFIWVFVIVLSIILLRKILKKRIENVSIRYKAQKGIEVIGYLLIGLLVLMAIMVDSPKPKI